MKTRLGKIIGRAGCCALGLLVLVGSVYISRACCGCVTGTMCTEAGALRDGNPADCDGYCTYWNTTTFNYTSVTVPPNTGGSHEPCPVKAASQTGGVTRKHWGTVLGICVCLATDYNYGATWSCNSCHGTDEGC